MSHTEKIIFNTREQLKDYVHSIHDYIRNSGAGYGMDALKIFNVFYSLKIIRGKTKELGLPEIFEWENIKNNKEYSRGMISSIINQLRINVFTEHGTSHPLYRFLKKELHGLIEDKIIDAKSEEIKKILKDIIKPIDKKIAYIQNIHDGIKNTEFTEDELKDIEKMRKSKNIAYFMYHQIPEKLEDDFYVELIKKIDRLPDNNEEDNFDLRGKIYEYFIGRDKQAISDLGAYFTDRHITNFCMLKGEIEINDNKVPIIGDIFGGSGGFTLQAVDYINKTFGFTNNEWYKNDNYKNIKHYDMAENVIKIAGVEFFSQTGYFPDHEFQFCRVNSFKYEFGDKNIKFDRLFSNPPYGGDKNSKTPEIIRLETISEENEKFIKNKMIEFVGKSTQKQKEFQNMRRLIEKLDDSDIFEEKKFDKNKISKKLVKITKKFCEVTNIDFDKCSDDFYKLAVRIIQNRDIKPAIKNEIKELQKEKVNFSTCSEFIKEYSRDVTEYCDIETRELYRKEIDNLLKSEKDITKKTNLELAKGKNDNKRYKEKSFERKKLIDELKKYNEQIKKINNKLDSD